jgi:hypothetical protein
MKIGHNMITGREWKRRGAPFYLSMVFLVFFAVGLSKSDPLQGVVIANQDEIIPTFGSGDYSQVEGYYKDLFMDSGVELSSRKSLPAADALGLSMEYIAVGDSGEVRQNRWLVSNPDVDDNGILLYPDGSPRFRMVYVNGGDSLGHGNSLGETGRQRIRDFFHGGGSYSGSCAGAFFSALH